MDFDRIETQVLFDDNGKIANIVATSRNDAHKLIEECMLMANPLSLNRLRLKIDALAQLSLRLA
jgi:ribonuclease R